jgi:hypothetical protein
MIIYGYKNYLASLMVVLCLSISAQAQTCSNYLMSWLKVDIGLFIGIPVLGWATGIISIDYELKKYHAATRLKAASILNSIYSQRDKAKAQEIIDLYYQKLLHRYPTMTLGKQEVVDLLHRYNENSVRYGDCFCDITTRLFPDSKAAQYLANEKKWDKEIKKRKNIQIKAQEKYAEEIEHAAKIRREKNGVGELQIYDDI